MRGGAITLSSNELGTLYLLYNLFVFLIVLTVYTNCAIMSSMILPLSNTQEDEIAYIDEADYELVKDMRWLVLRQKRDGYTQKYVIRHYYANKDWTSPKCIYLHRFIMKPTGVLVVDHIDGNGLDNRRTNLRNVTLSQNSLNKHR